MFNRRAKYTFLENAPGSVAPAFPKGHPPSSWRGAHAPRMDETQIRVEDVKRWHAEQVMHHEYLRTHHAKP